MVKAVIFDIDGVLLDSFEANLKYFQELFPMLGYRTISKEEYRPLFYSPMYDVIRDFTGAPKEKVDEMFETAKNERSIYVDDLLTVPEQAYETLLALHEKYLLGIVSNRVQKEVWEIPFIGKIKPLLKGYVFYEDTKNHKPDPEPLLLAASRLNCKPEVCVYIGDAQIDVDGGHNAGMKVIAFPNLGLPGADKETNSFKELPQIIASL